MPAAKKYCTLIIEKVNLSVQTYLRDNICMESGKVGVDFEGKFDDY